MRGRNRPKGPNPLTRSYESNGPDVKIRGTAQHIADKYAQLARDAQASGDPVAAENYFQHGEHYFRIISGAQEQNRLQAGGYARNGFDDGDDDGDDETQGQGYAANGYGANGYADDYGDPAQQPQPPAYEARQDQAPDTRANTSRERFQNRNDQPRAQRFDNNRRYDGQRPDNNARQENTRQDNPRQDQGRPDYGRQDQGRQDNPRQDNPRQDYGRQDQPRNDYARQNQARNEPAREASRYESGRGEQASPEARSEPFRSENGGPAAFRPEAPRQEAHRQEGLRPDGPRQDAPRQDALRQDAARPDARRPNDAPGRRPRRREEPEIRPASEDVAGLPAFLMAPTRPVVPAEPAPSDDVSHDRTVEGAGEASALAAPKPRRRRRARFEGSDGVETGPAGSEDTAPVVE